MTTGTRSFILGIHHFCDHRCWRCPMQARCAVASRVTQHNRFRDGGDPVSRVAAVTAASLEVTLEELSAMVTASGADAMPASGPMPQPNMQPASQEMRDVERQTTEAEQDPLVARGAEYARASWRVLRSLRTRLARRADRQAGQAAERLEETCLTIASKTFRAVSSALADGQDASDLQSDANGSAKVALLLIEEARRDWRVLMRKGESVANGVPARMAFTLDELERDLSARFPKALDFVRPGFDTKGIDGEDAALARAMLATGERGPAS